MILMAPLSNDALRDWPRSHYARLIDLLLSGTEHEIVLVGSAEQRQELNLHVRGRPVDRIQNNAGLWTWSKTIESLQRADLVIANNSGVAHVSAEMGRATLCLFAASHNPHEWGPRGARAITLYVRTACSPCSMSTQWGCAFGHACMRQLTPEIVFGQATEVLLEAR
jgi:ADP-heptose:LPS heptosyltransferase